MFTGLIYNTLSRWDTAIPAY